MDISQESDPKSQDVLSLLRIPLNVFDKVQSVYLSHFYFHSTKLRKEPIKAFVLTVISLLSEFVWAPT